ncbi:MBL fold metallo-hydrolase [Ilumatobacter sp.]|uniref:MBL fold metallo-hydrolase n=1 Tax=Ilumatobacter sp. TaxID=1967498 RepID=UPI003AF50A4B
MTTTITITGTGCPIPSATRAGPGVLVRHGDLALQFDAGRSTVMRLTGAGLALGELSAVFVTHHHSDHLTGLQDLVLSRWVMDRTAEATPLPVVAPAGPATEFVAEMLDAWRHDVAVRNLHMGRTDLPAVDLRPFEYPSTPAEVWREGGVRVLAGQVRHEPVRPAVGFRVETPDGVVAITGDTLVCDEVAALATGVDVLVYEAMRFAPLERLPKYRQIILGYHADTRLIGAQAAELDVATLVLTHLIPPPDAPGERELFAADVRDAGFEGAVMVADDLDVVTLG